MKSADAILCTFALLFVVLIGSIVTNAFKAAVDAPFAHIPQQEARAD